MPRKHRFHSPALQHTYERFIAGDKEREERYERALENADVARKLYDLRAAAGLTQRQLARLVGTSASVICQLEDADYEGHSMAMLRRIAAALDKRVEIRFVPVRKRTA
jgi:DNA-binding XRE family transcriptional regulator